MSPIIGLALFATLAALPQGATWDGRSRAIFTYDASAKEGMIAPEPEGFIPTDQKLEGDGEALTYFPGGETRQAWTRMVLVTKLNETLPMELADYDLSLHSEMPIDCDTPNIKKLEDGMDGGLAYSEWLVSCPFDVSTEAAETIVIKSIKGRYSFLSVAYGFRGAPSKAHLADAKAYLATVRVMPPQASHSESS